jgi:hypothetical protein
VARDPRVEAAIANWGPRFVANGVPYPDFVEVTGPLRRRFFRADGGARSRVEVEAVSGRRIRRAATA